MRKYYTRPCNFFYGNYAKKLIKTRKALNEENMKLKDIFIKPINKKIKLSIYEVIMITLFVFVASNGLYHL